MSELVQLFRESVVIQGVLTLVVVGAAVWLLALGQPVPDQLWGFVGLVLGYYFGSDRVNAIRRAISERFDKGG